MITNKKGARTNQEEKSKQWEKRQKKKVSVCLIRNLRMNLM